MCGFVVSVDSYSGRSTSSRQARLRGYTAVCLFPDTAVAPLPHTPRGKGRGMAPRPEKVRAEQEGQHKR
jgi:hypothetical protein